MISSFYESGGWGMYPTTIFGFFLVAIATVYLLRPDRRRLSLIISLGVATFASGLLGCSVGMIRTFTYARGVAPDEQLASALAGSSESLNNLVLALLFILLAALVVAGGLLRAPQATESVGKQ